jgi:uncharacterized protein
MNQLTNHIPPDVEYHRVLAGEKRRIGRGVAPVDREATPDRDRVHG